jgi:hypothetical protein
MFGRTDTTCGPVRRTCRADGAGTSATESNGCQRSKVVRRRTVVPMRMHSGAVPNQGIAIGRCEYGHRCWAQSRPGHVRGWMTGVAGWWVVVGTLGGVLVTAVAGLVTATLTHRWQQERLRLEQRFVSERELQTARREAYARYLLTAQRLFDTANALHRQHNTAPVDVPDVFGEAASRVKRSPGRQRGRACRNHAACHRSCTRGSRNL